MAAAEERGSSVLDLLEARRGHFHDADLLGRAVAVLERTQQAQGAVAIALEHQHRIDEMLQRTRTGQRAVLGDVADQQHRHIVLACERAQLDGRLAHLTHRAGRTAEPVDLDRLDGVDDQQRRWCCRRRGDDDSHVRARQHRQRTIGRTTRQPQACCAKVQLGG